MQLNISNIGCVESAEIKVNQITVVAGENASGKSTISKALFSILNMGFDTIARAYDQKDKSEKTKLRNIVVHSSTGIYVSKSYSLKGIIDLIQDLYLKSNGQKEVFVEDMKNSEIFHLRGTSEENIDKFVESIFGQLEEVKDKGIDYYVDYLQQLILSGVFKDQVNCRYNMQPGNIRCEGLNNISRLDIADDRIVNKVLSPHDIIEDIQPIYIDAPDLMRSIQFYISDDVGNYSGSELARLLVKEKNFSDLVAEDYETLEMQRKVLNEIFELVLDGEIQIKNSRMDYYDNKCHSNLEFGNVASGMKLFLILSKLVENRVFLHNTCLILDEPESNQHPRWQLLMAKLLVLLNHKMGVKVYLNSHSPYFVRAIEYYANEYNILDGCNFYVMEPGDEFGMYHSREVTEQLGVIYDQLAQPFNEIM